MNIRINTPDVIHESFDNESVIVNLRLGIYFSLNEAGLPLWEQISQGTSEEQLCASWQEKHGGTAEEAQTVARTFLYELQQEQLIAGDLPEPIAPPAGSPSATTVRPALQKFTDLQDLLALDPVHDVDERGWPHAKPADETTPAA